MQTISVEELYKNEFDNQTYDNLMSLYRVIVKGFNGKKLSEMTDKGQIREFLMYQNITQKPFFTRFLIKCMIYQKDMLH
jgi:hypothetical protein